VRWSAATLPDPGPAATIVTVLDTGPTSITVRHAGTSYTLVVPGPVVIQMGDLLQLNLREVRGSAPWTVPTTSNSDVLRSVSAMETNGFLIAQLRSVNRGTARVQARFPCGPGACAAALLDLEVVVDAP
jgi:hypothetical protein